MKLPFIFIAEVLPEETYHVRCALDALGVPFFYNRVRPSQIPGAPRLGLGLYGHIKAAAYSVTWPQLFEIDDDGNSWADEARHTLNVLARSLFSRGLWLRGASGRPATPGRGL